PGVTYYQGQYQIGPLITPGILQSQLGSGTQTASDISSTAQQFLHASEDVYALYGQYEIKQGPLAVVGGVRYEKTHGRFDALGTTTDDIAPFPVTGSRQYSNFFPSLQAKYEVRPDLQVRAAYSSTIARPGFNQVNPSLFVDTGANIISRGNPALKPATANSFDLSIEQYLADAGVLSFGIFDKEIKDYIVSSIINDPNGGGVVLSGLTGPVKIATYSNANKSYARGFELNYEQRFKNLPGLLSGLGAGFNWTHVNSRFEIRPGEYATLPSSSKNTANATLFYERDGLGLRLAGYYVSKDLFGIQGPGIDIYNSARFSMDFGGTMAINKHLTAYFNAKNLLNTPHRFEEGISERVYQREFYGKTYQLGLNFNY
ncbi:MAG: TonB-dependent receptor, partial [Pseudomonadota bacterium]|nr:TonB-dependent receptor [Pseudomonadota bacterium]